MDPTDPNLAGGSLFAASGHGVPVWLVALLLAIAAPVLVRLYADALERETARRTARFLARLSSGAPPSSRGDETTSTTESPPSSADRRET